MSRRSLFVGVLIAAGLLATACTGKTPDGGSSPSATTSPPTSAAGGLPYAGAPKVPNPLPVSVLSGNPCADALTAAQIDTLLGSPVQTKQGETSGVGPDCGWSNLDKGSQIGVGYDTTTHTGLSGNYQNTQPKSAVWKPLPDIQGFPAVAHAGNKGQPALKDFCAVSVGLADDTSIDVSVSLGRAKIGSVDPCDVAGQAADAVVTTLKAKAGS
ncbi:DUF3558 domain-containing protein [Amycolatopsis sp. NBC_00345]|uniref:DUF3558 domain-containing protein n=1 Tax=Amycolatopsis sp. NBC_00345 TaxID=2975955 RepID=UPI002E272BDC